MEIWLFIHQMVNQFGHLILVENDVIKIISIYSGILLKENQESSHSTDGLIKFFQGKVFRFLKNIM